jgi:hypothetical protein
MPKFNVSSSSKYSAPETFKKIRELFENDRDLKKMDPGYVSQFDESKLNGSAKGGKFEAQMRIVPSGNSCSVEIEVNLPLMLTPLKGVVQSTLQKKLETALA